MPRTKRIDKGKRISTAINSVRLEYEYDNRKDCDSAARGFLALLCCHCRFRNVTLDGNSKATKMIPTNVYSLFGTECLWVQL